MAWNSISQIFILDKKNLSCVGPSKNFAQESMLYYIHSKADTR